MTETEPPKKESNSVSSEQQESVESKAEATEAEAPEVQEELEEAAPPAVEEEEEEEAVEEKIYTIPLGRAWIYPRPERAPKSIKLIRKYVLRHMKPEDVKIQDGLNRYIWARSIEKPPRRVRVRVTRDKEGVAKVYLFQKQQ